MGKGIDTFITGNADMTWHPAETNRFMPYRDTEEPVLDFLDKRMGCAEELEKGERGAIVCENCEG